MQSAPRIRNRTLPGFPPGFDQPISPIMEAAQYRLAPFFFLLYVNWILQNASFCAWLFSLNIIFLRLIHVVACGCISFILVAHEYCVIWLYSNIFTVLLLVGIWVTSGFGYYKKCQINESSWMSFIKHMHISVSVYLGI